MKAGDIIFSKNNSIGSFIIRWYQQSNWSHVRLMISDTTFIEASWPKVRVGNISELKNFKVMSLRVPLTVSQQMLLSLYATKYIGKKFDMLGLLSFIFRVKIQNKSWYFCSELIAEVFSRLEQPLLRRSSAQVKPQDLFQSEELVEAQ